MGEASDDAGARFTYRLGDPGVRVERFATGQVDVIAGGVLEVLADELARIATPAQDLPFTGGLVGWFGYELKADLGFPPLTECQTRSEVPQTGARRVAPPDADWLLIDRFVVLDHELERAELVALVPVGPLDPTDPSNTDPNNPDPSNPAHSAALAWFERAGLVCRRAVPVARSVSSGAPRRAPGPADMQRAGGRVARARTTSWASAQRSRRSRRGRATRSASPTPRASPSMGRRSSSTVRCAQRIRPRMRPTSSSATCACSRHHRSASSTSTPAAGSRRVRSRAPRPASPAPLLVITGARQRRDTAPARGRDLPLGASTAEGGNRGPASARRRRGRVDDRRGRAITMTEEQIEARRAAPAAGSSWIGPRGGIRRDAAQGHAAGRRRHQVIAGHHAAHQEGAPRGGGRAGEGGGGADGGGRTRTSPLARAGPARRDVRPAGEVAARAGR